MTADEIFQQELFADCARHASDTTREAEGAQVVFRLNMLIKTSPFPGQRIEILKWLDTFLQSPVYADVANRVLNSLITNHALPDTLTTIQAALILFNRAPQSKTSELQPVYQQLLEMAQEESFSFEQMIKAARLLREGGLPTSIKQHALSIMLSLAQEPQLPPAQVIDAIWTICDNTTSRSKIRKEAYQLLLQLAQRPDLSIADATEAADALYNLSPDASLEKQQAIQLLLDLSQRRDIPFGDAVQAAFVLHGNSPEGSEEHRQAAEMLLEQAHWADITFEQTVEAAIALNNISRSESYRLQAAQVIFEIAKRSDLTMQQRIEFIRNYYGYQPEEHRLMRRHILLELAQQPGISVEQAIEVVPYLNLPDFSELEEARSLITACWELAHRLELSIEQTTAILGDLLFYYPPQSPELRQIVQTFIELAQHPDLTFEQAIQINYIFNRKPLRSKQYLAFQLLFALAQRPELTTDEAEKLAQALYQRSQPGARAIRNMPFDQFLLHSVTAILKSTAAQYWEKEQAVNMLMQMVSKEVARSYLKLCWKPSKSDKTDPLDPLALVELVQEELLPLEVRDEIYQILRRAASPI
jgi:hypothetical protein